ncbi:Immediate early response gene 2 protein [Fukomys damarensis]|uniref:Immediate early response gene 2 protein n=1 Tax=Fukomys damarensis TaxID=885580 RepID=A0A091D9K0_FUKDA|nr:Immediate early response gene 2 protein [Fukomys damarensis]
MEVQKEAQRIMTLSVWKMYHSRMQRGGLRLHRSLQLSLVMRSARELYLSAKTLARSSPRPARVGRKRRSSSLSDGVDTGLVPSKKARLEEQEEAEEASSEVPDHLLPPLAQAEGAFPNLARVLQRNFSGLLNCGPTTPTTSPPARDAKPVCRPADPVLSVLVRAVVAF